jgi:hypothetical protein
MTPQEKTKEKVEDASVHFSDDNNDSFRSHDSFETNSEKSIVLLSSPMPLKKTKNESPVSKGYRLHELQK